jgi:serine/threonine protein phosphatase PrpC
MEVRTLLKKGTDHLVNCEDDLFFSEYNGYHVAAVFDGCSTGYKSHFASSLFGKLINSALKSRTYPMFDEGCYTLEELARSLFFRFFHKMQEVENVLDLRDIELVSTFIIAIIKDNKAFVMVSGDGCIMVDDIEHELESINNAPDYLAYHLKETVFYVWANNIKKFEFDNITTGLSICSDGIYSFRNPDADKSCDVVKESLLHDKAIIGSDAMLARKYNILFKEGYSNYDDLSIVRFIF